MNPPLPGITAITSLWSFPGEEHIDPRSRSYEESTVTQDKAFLSSGFLSPSSKIDRTLSGTFLTYNLDHAAPSFQTLPLEENSNFPCPSQSHPLHPTFSFWYQTRQSHPSTPANSFLPCSRGCVLPSCVALGRFRFLFWEMGEHRYRPCRVSDRDPVG